MTITLSPVALYLVRSATFLGALALNDRLANGVWDLPLWGFALGAGLVLIVNAPELRARLRAREPETIDAATLARLRPYRPMLAGAGLAVALVISLALVVPGLALRPFLAKVVSVTLMLLSNAGRKAVPLGAGFALRRRKRPREGETTP